MALTAMILRKDNNIIFGCVSCNQNKLKNTKHVNFMCEAKLEQYRKISMYMSKMNC